MNDVEGGIIWILIIGSVILYFMAYRKKVAQLKMEYEQALRGIDKRAALQAGWAYYSALRRKARLTIYDEQAITNDLSAMDEVRKS